MYLFSIITGIAQLLLISTILVKEVQKKSPAVFLWATLFVMFAVPHLITVLFRDMSYSITVVFKASLFVCGFCLMYLLIRSREEMSFLTLKGGKRLEIENSRIQGSLFEYICFFVFLAAIIGYICYIVYSEGGLWHTSWAGARAVETNYVSMVGLASHIIIMFSGLSLYFFLTNSRIKAGIVLALFVCLVIVTRNRVLVLPVLIFIISVYLIRIKSIKIQHIVVGLIMAIGAIYVVYAIRAFRHLGSLSNAATNFSWSYLNSKILEFINDRNGELGLRQYFYYFIENQNRFEGFNKGYTYIRMLLVYLPSKWSFGIKPQSFDLYMGQAIGLVAGGSTHPTLFGDCFGNLNWFGFILGGLWAGLANGADAILTRQKDSFFRIMLYFMASYSFVLIGRGSVYNGFEKFAWGLLLLLAFKVLLSRTTFIQIKLNDRSHHSGNKPHNEVVFKRS